MGRFHYRGHETRDFEPELHGPDFARPRAILAPATWVSGASDAKWHCTKAAVGAPMHCLCGHQIRGAVHLRRDTPADGALDRTLCAAALAELSQEPPINPPLSPRPQGTPDINSTQPLHDRPRLPMTDPTVGWRPAYPGSVSSR